MFRVYAENAGKLLFQRPGLLLGDFPLGAVCVFTFRGLFRVYAENAGRLLFQRPGLFLGDLTFGAGACAFLILWRPSRNKLACSLVISPSLSARSISASSSGLSSRFHCQALHWKWWWVVPQHRHQLRRRRCPLTARKPVSGNVGFRFLGFSTGSNRRFQPRLPQSRGFCLIGVWGSWGSVVSVVSVVSLDSVDSVGSVDSVDSVDSDIELVSQFQWLFLSRLFFACLSCSSVVCSSVVCSSTASSSAASSSVVCSSISSVPQSSVPRPPLPQPPLLRRFFFSRFFFSRFFFSHLFFAASSSATLLQSFFLFFI